MAQPVEVRGWVMLTGHEGAPVGFVSAGNLADPVYGILLDCLHVLKTHQGFRFGRLMIEAVRRWTREQTKK